ncbi:hypothetical protein LXL04_038676 [Taraxacum kok-saghyz]
MAWYTPPATFLPAASADAQQPRTAGDVPSPLTVGCRKAISSAVPTAPVPVFFSTPAITEGCFPTAIPFCRMKRKFASVVACVDCYHLYSSFKLMFNPMSSQLESHIEDYITGLEKDGIVVCCSINKGPYTYKITNDIITSQEEMC